MRLLLFSLLILLFISCEKQDLCDLTQYPSAPYVNADDTLYGDTFIRYLYVCYNQSSYNKIYTYTIIDSCWVLDIKEDYNFNCP